MRTTRWLIAPGIALVVLSGLIWYGRSGEVDSAAEDLAQARAELKASNPRHALKLAQGILETAPDSIDALLIAGEAAAHLQNFSAALEYYGNVPADSSPTGLQATFGQGEVLFHLGRLAESEEKLRSVLNKSPDHSLSHYRLSILLGVTGRRWEAVSHQMKLLKRGQVSVHDLILLCDTARTLDQRDFLLKCLGVSADAPRPHLGLALVALSENRRSDAERRLRKVVQLEPELAEAQARLGGLLVSRGNELEFQQWHRALLPAADSHPGVWKARGDWARSHGDTAGAARCYFEGVRIMPNDRLLNYRLGLSLQALERDADASIYLDRYSLLQQLAIIADGLHHNPQDQAGIQKAAILTERLGRIWETWAWCRAALVHQPRSSWAATTIERLTVKLDDACPDVLTGSHPLHLADLSDLALPEWISVTRPLRQQKPTGSDAVDRTAERRASTPIRFVDLARHAGVDFQYENGADLRTKGARIIETTGGGVAVLDFDGDLLPDLYFTQGGRWPDQPPADAPHDRLFRNRGDGTFVDVSAAAGLTSSRFSQGVAVGDVNADGFPDLYVACIGPNRLYLNNGDGTFSTSAVATMQESPVWTTSCLIADLNDDQLPEIYDVNYCRDDAGFPNICGDASLPRACSPLAFIAETDRLLVNVGDGTFRDSSQASNIDLPNGYGLGIVAGQIAGDGGLDLFVANDQVSNFLFVNETERPGDVPVFSEEALLRGLAADGEGRRQGCMGIAAGDVNDDGELDFLVTNFYQESNALYVSNSSKIYEDASQRANLRDASFAMLGFGTQFLDYDLDGRQDLTVANGHVDDLSALGQPHRMPPQFFRRTSGSPHFSHIAETERGSYYAGRFLGRGLARWDWNADGREEFVVSNIGDNCSLVANLTETAFHFLAVRLVGTASSRDAIGAVIRVSTPNKTITRHLVAGDGFQCSNQRRIVFGLGDDDVVEQIQVRWPSGNEETFSSPSIDEDILLIERRGAYRLPDVRFDFPVKHGSRQSPTPKGTQR